MATNLAIKPSASEPVIPDEDIERLIAEMFGRARRPAPPAAAPLAPRPPVVVRPPQQQQTPLAPEPVIVAETEIASPVEPLQLSAGARRRSKWTTPLILTVLALGGGWWLASSGLIPAPRPQATSQTPPVIAAAPPAASRVVDPPADSPSASVTGAAPLPVAAPIAIVPPPAAIASAPVEAAARPAPPPAPTATAPIPIAAPASAADGAGVLGTPQPTPFDMSVSPRAVRTTAVIPPRTAEASNSVKPIDFDDPATWPPGSEKAESHPLPPRRR